MFIFGGNLLLLHQQIGCCCKGSSKKCDKQVLKSTSTFQQFMGKLAEELELGALDPTFSRPSHSTYPYSKFWPIFHASFSKCLQDRLQAFTNQTIHELLLTRSNYRKTSTPHKFS